jgi:DNA-binding MarR family transcriptional regulator
VTQTDVVDDLVRRGWAEIDGDVYALTADGEEAYSRLSLDVATLRAQVTDGFTAEEYAAVIEALAKMAANLEGH